MVFKTIFNSVIVVLVVVVVAAAIPLVFDCS